MNQNKKSPNSKLKVAIILTFIIILIFGKNILERKNFNELGDTLVSVYEDRLVVESYIFNISEKLFRIKLLVNHCAFESDYTHVIEDISTYENEILAIVEDFENTNLTVKEGEFLSDFKKIISENLRIQDYDLLFTQEGGINSVKVIQYNEYIERAINDLDRLSSIQIEEGKRLYVNAEKVVNRSRIWAQFEVAALVILLIIIYLLIYTTKSIKSKFLR
jgi:hypothetical protein